MTPSDLLERAADKIQFRGWCREVSARTTTGAGTVSFDPNATAWCGGGAVIAEAFVDDNALALGTALDALNQYCLARFGKTVAIVNDCRVSSASEMADVMRACAKTLRESL